MSLLGALKSRVARSIRPPPEPAPDPREILAKRYVTGSGVEFGALHFPLVVPPGASVRYADMHAGEELKAAFPDVENIRAVDFVTDLESMKGIDPESQDFVIANHVLEHVEDPLRALESIARTLRPHGIAYLALPDKRFTFDKGRALTPLDHLIRDHRDGPDWSLVEHYEEWVRCVDSLSGAEHHAKVSLMVRQRSNIHFHVWDYPAMQEFFAYVARDSAIGLEIEASMLNGIEVVWILRKVR
jgi:SAM-dependent methyltransferase